MRTGKDILFATLNLVQAAVVGALPLMAPSREGWFAWVLWGAAGLMLLAAPALVFGGRWGSRLAATACLVHFALGALLAALLVFSTSYLYTIYGHHGTTLGNLALVLAAGMLVLFWLIPAHELAWLRTRGQET